MCEEFGSGRRVAMDTRLLACIILCVVVVDVEVGGGGLTAIDTRLGRRFLVVLFSLPSATILVLNLLVVGAGFLDGRGDGAGMKLVSLRNGILIFEGANGGFFSILPCCFIVDKPED